MSEQGSGVLLQSLSRVPKVACVRVSQRSGVSDGPVPRQTGAWRPAMSRFKKPSSRAMRCVFFHNPR